MVGGNVEFLKHGINKFKMMLCELILKDLCLQIQIILLRTPIEEIEVPNFYLDMDVLNCLCHCVSNLDITNDLFDLNRFIDMEDVNV